VDEIRKITRELAKIDEGKVKAIAEGDRVYLMIQDAPAELRRLADALEKIDVREIKALVAYAKPGAEPLRKESSRTPKQLETAFPSPIPDGLEKRLEAVLARFRPRLRKVGADVALASIEGGVAKLRFTAKGECPPEGARLQAEVRDAVGREVPELKGLEVVS